MPDNTNEQIENKKVETQEQADRKKRTEKRDKSTLITDAEHTNHSGSNFFENRVFDIGELLNTGTEDEIKKINRLKEYGVTEEMIVSIYKDMSGNVTTKNDALETISKIFDKLVVYISNLPNAIVLDPETGYIDREASIAQGYEVGIYSNNSELFFIENSSEPIIKKIPDDIKENLSKQISYESYNAFWEYKFLMENFDDRFIKEEITENIDDSLDKSIEELRVSNELKDATMRRRESIESSEYEQDPNLYEITSLELEYFNATEPAKSILKAKIDKFYENNPEYKGKITVELNEQGKVALKNGQSKLNELHKFENFKNAYKFEAIVYQLDRIADLTQEQFEQLDIKDKKVITMALFRGYSYERNSDYKLLSKACEEKIKKFFPDLDLDKKNQKINRIGLANIAKKILEIPINKEELSFEAFYKFNNDKMDLATDNYLRNNKDSYKNKTFDLQDANLNFSYTSAVENYFAGTGIELSENIEQRYEFLYKSYTVNSWIDDKNQALKLRYLSIQSMKENYKRSPETNYTKRRISELEQEEKEFWEKHGKEFIEVHGDPKKWSEKKKKINTAEYDHYKNNKVLAEITKFYTRDMLDFQKGLTYEKMNSDEKKAYIRNSLSIYNMVKNETGDKNAILAKTILRRFELMNSDDKKFVTFDKNGKAIINEELIFEEYKLNSPKGHEWTSFEELLQASEQKKEKYLVENLVKICEQKTFTRIGSKQDLDRAFERTQIAKIKVKEERIKEENEKKLTNRDFDSAIKAGKFPVEQLNDSAVKEVQEKAKIKEKQNIEQEDSTTKSDDSVDNPNGGSDSDANSLEELESIIIQNPNLQLIDPSTLGIMGRGKLLFERIKGFIFGKHTNQTNNQKRDVTKKEENKEVKQDKNVNQAQTINSNEKSKSLNEFDIRMREGVSQPIVHQVSQSNESTQSIYSENQVGQQEDTLKNNDGHSLD